MSVSPPGSPVFNSIPVKRKNEDDTKPGKKARNEEHSSLTPQIPLMSLPKTNLRLTDDRVKSGDTQFILPEELSNRVEKAVTSVIPNPIVDPLEVTSNQDHILNLMENQTTISRNQIQALLEKMKSGSELSLQEWGTIYKIAESNNIQIIDFLIDYSIDAMNVIIEKNNELMRDDDLNSLYDKLSVDGKLCLKLIHTYGHLKSYLRLEFDNDDEGIEFVRFKFFLLICRNCPNIKSIEVGFNEIHNGENIVSPLLLFLEEFTKTSSNLKHLVNCKFAVPVTDADILSKVIDAISHHPVTFQRVSLRIFQDPCLEEDSYQDNLSLLGRLNHTKVESLSLNIDGDYPLIEDLPFLKDLPLHEATLDYSEDGNRFKSNIKELSTYPQLEKLILVTTNENIKEFTSTLPFKRIIIREIEDQGLIKPENWGISPIF